MKRGMRYRNKKKEEGGLVSGNGCPKSIALSV